MSHALYAKRCPESVAGLILLDPAHKDQLARLPPPPAGMMLVMKHASRAAAVGLPQILMGSLDPVINQTRHVRTTGAELRALLDSRTVWPGGELDLGTTPVYVLTADDHSRMPGKSDEERKRTRRIWRSLHAEIVAASRSRICRHVEIEGSSHYVHRSRRDVVVEFARERVERLETEPRRSR